MYKRIMGVVLAVGIVMNMLVAVAVEVNASGVVDIPHIKVEGSDVIRITEGDVKKLNIETISGDVSGENFYWKSSDQSIVRVDRVTGYITGVRAGETVVIVSNEGGIDAAVKVVVKSAVGDIRIINGPQGEVKKGYELNLKCEIDKNTTEELEVTWESSNPGIVKVDNKGNITALDKGTSKVTVSVLGGKYSAWVNIRVGESGSSGEQGAEKLQGIEVKNSKVEIMMEETKKLDYELSPAGAKDASIYFDTSNPEIAYVDDTGNVTGVSPGKVTVEVHNGRGIKAYYNITVKNEYVYVYVRDIEITNKGPIEMVEGDEETLTLNINPNSSSEAKILWESSDSKVVTVKDGKLKAVGDGKATITAKSYGNKGVEDTIKVEVTKYVLPATGINIANKEIEILVGESVQIDAEINPEDTTETKLTFETDDSNIELTSTGLVKALDAGTVEVIVGIAGTDIKETVTINIKYKESYWGVKTKVERLNEKKDITIKLSLPVDIRSVEDNVIITKDASGNGDKLDVTMELSKDGRTIIIRNKPLKVLVEGEKIDTDITEWGAGETYYVFIKSGLKSTNGYLLGTQLSYELKMR